MDDEFKRRLGADIREIFPVLGIVNRGTGCLGDETSLSVAVSKTGRTSVDDRISWAASHAPFEPRAVLSALIFRGRESSTGHNFHFQLLQMAHNGPYTRGREKERHGEVQQLFYWKFV